MSFDVYGGALMLETLKRNIEMVDFSAALLKVKPFEAQ
ncbi:hypothetical protein JCM19241_4824 [Vibrio ishigakensis]|uniref:Uncharacterized protein n=1 Tax=Vibrio ishigakensis TaxID=1481914 RepID=A0A0B8QVF5_9VIBR|nr:hypothetical protein JCM19241_4824 [Vibrio ishigakensis]